MELSLNVFAVINTLGALQCLLTAVALISIKSGHRTANRYLGGTLIALAILILDWVMYDTHFFLIVPQLYNVLDPFVLLIGPFFLLYIRALTGSGHKFTAKSLLHFLPFAILFALLFLTVFEDPQIKIQQIKSELGRADTSMTDYILKTIVNVQVLSYFFVSLRILGRAIREKFSRPQQAVPVNLKWLRFLIIAIISISLVSAFFDYFPIVGGIDSNSYITPFLLTLIIYSMAYVGIRQSEIFTAQKLLGQGRKYEKSVLTDEMAEEILDRLRHLMDEEKLYTDSLISLPKLAERLRITTHLLSQILNERLNRNFFNFISEHRVEAAKVLLLDPASQHITMLELAYEVGFNSLSAFNTAFKKHAGMSPSEYKKQNG